MGDFNNLGNDLKNKINNAVSSHDFEQLSDDISGIINGALSGLRSGITATGTALKNSLFSSKSAELTPYPTNKRALPSGYGMPSLVCGIAGGVLLGAATISTLLLFIIINSVGLLVTSAAMLIGSVSCFIAAHSGYFSKNLKKKFDRYCSLMSDRTYYEISYLSEQLRQPRKQTIKELSKLIQLGAFPQGHIDSKKEYFIGDDATYTHYLTSMELAARRRSETDTEKLDKIRGEIDKGREHIRRIKQANTLILNDNISSKLNDTEIILGRIFDRVEQKPELLPDIRKLLEYYLPITQKLLDAYIDLDSQSSSSDNIEKSKTEIEKSLDTINTAFFNLYNSLFDDDKVDIISDISVLRAMFAQEGLNKNDFSGENSSS